jgi:hypothetical protein
MTIQVLHRKLEMESLRYAACLLGDEPADPDIGRSSKIKDAPPGVVLPQDA